MNKFILLVLVLAILMAVVFSYDLSQNRQPTITDTWKAAAIINCKECFKECNHD